MKFLKTILIIISFFQISFTQQIHFQKIIPFDGQEGDAFGVRISALNNFLAVGAHLKSETGYLSGCVYLYKFSEDSIWIFSEKLIPNDLNERDRLSTVKLYNNYAFLGAWTKEYIGSQSGVVYVFENKDTNWTQIQKVIPQFLSPGADFGTAIDVNKNFLFIGASSDTSNLKKQARFLYSKNQNYTGLSIRD